MLCKFDLIGLVQDPRHGLMLCISCGNKADHGTDHRALTKAPVMWSHSCSRNFNNISRNVPDEVLDKVGRGRGKVDGVVMVK